MKRVRFQIEKVYPVVNKASIDWPRLMISLWYRGDILILKDLINIARTQLVDKDDK